MRTIKDGLYSVRFANGATDFGAGTIALRAGALNGGDHGFSYQGRLDEQASHDAIALSGHIKVHRWNPQVHSVINGVNDYQLDVVGQYHPQTQTIELKGNSSSFHGVTLQIRGCWLADLVE